LHYTVNLHDQLKQFLADRTNRAIGRVLRPSVCRLSPVVVCDVMYCG